MDGQYDSYNDFMSFERINSVQFYKKNQIKLIFGALIEKKLLDIVFEQMIDKIK